MARRSTKDKKGPKQLNVKLPKGYKIVQGDGFAKSFFFTKPGQSVEGKVVGVKDVKYQGKKRFILTLETNNGAVAIWDSAMLLPLFDEIKKGDEVYIRFEGLSAKKKKGQNAAKIFTTAIKD